MEYLAKRDISRTHFIAILAALGLSLLGSFSLIRLFEPTWHSIAGVYGANKYGTGSF